MTKANNQDKLKSMMDMVEDFDKEVDEKNTKTREEMNRLLTDDLTNRGQDREESNSEWVWEMVKTSGVFNKFLQEENEKMLRLGGEIARMYLSGKSIREIAEQTNLSEQKIKELVRVLG
ncbi:hypothetical protein V8Z81_31965 (plasmid) [Priestia megaterium]|uniref:helix-turn-helix domain-containing protein n=1 Tax=Priestia megaterium TaxID=1404 RepID=UPI0030CEA2B2